MFSQNTVNLNLVDSRNMTLSIGCTSTIKIMSTYNFRFWLNTPQFDFRHL